MEARAADPALLRALVIAWSVQPDLTRQTLAGWLREHLFVEVTATDLNVALAALREEGALDEQGRPQEGRMVDLVDEWRLRAWVREAQRGENADDSDGRIRGDDPLIRAIRVLGVENADRSDGRMGKQMIR